MSKELLKELQEQLNNSPLMWGKFYCPKHFTIQSPWFHTELIEACVDCRYLAVASPRESSKSTLLTFLYPAYSIALKKRHFIIIVMNTYAKAAGALGTIKDEFKNNQMLIAHFGVKFEKDSEGDTVFVHPDGFKTRVLCKGHEQIGSVRGEKFGPYRPDLIIGDDLEDDVMVRSRDRRENLKSEFDDALIPAGDKQKCKYIFIGTILHDDSIMAKLVNKEMYLEYDKYFYRALNEIDGKEISLWEEKWSVADLKKMRADKPSVFAKEYQNDPVSGAMRRFHKKDFRYWTIENNEAVLFNLEGRVSSKFPLYECRAAIACDLAWEEKRESDFSVVVPGYLTPQSDILIDNYICKKGMRPHELEEILFSMEAKLRTTTKGTVQVGWEKAKLEKVMQFLLKQAMRRRNTYLVFKALVWDTDKIQRIETRLEPRYAQHTMYHRQGMGELEHQLERFPSGVHDDLCLAKGTKIATIFGDKNIEDMKVGDFVITPLGIRKVLEQAQTREAETIDLYGLTLTPDHKVFSSTSCFVSADMVCSSKELSRLKLKEVLRWRYKRLLSLMESNMVFLVQGREHIILVNQIQMREGKILKDFMWQFGNFIINKKFLKGLLFIIRMVMCLITTFLTWGCYHIANIINLSGLLQSTKKILIKFVRWLQHGIGQKRVELGTGNTLNSNGLILRCTILPVQSAMMFFNPHIPRQSVALKAVETKRNGEKRKLYNIKVDKDSVYYANGILVSNCDACQGLVQLLQHPKSARKIEQNRETEFDWWRNEAIKLHRPPKKPYVFGRKNKRIEIPAKIAYR